MTDLCIHSSAIHTSLHPFVREGAIPPTPSSDISDSVFRLSRLFRGLFAPHGLRPLRHNLQVGIRKIVSHDLHLIQPELRLHGRGCRAFWLRRKPSSPEHPCSFFTFHRCC